MRECPFAKTQKSSYRIAILVLPMFQPVARVLLMVSHDPDECDGGKIAHAFDSMAQVLPDLPMVAVMENFKNKG
jgi:hypothetical protein